MALFHIFGANYIKFIQLQIYLGYTANTYALFHSYVYGYCARYQTRSAVILLAANLRSSAFCEDGELLIPSIHLSKLR